MATILGANTLSSGYDVANSCRFNDDDSAYMHITRGSAGNQRTFTISMWIKRCKTGSSTVYFFASGADNNASFSMHFNSDQLEVWEYKSSAYQFRLKPKFKFTDVSAWYHVVVAVDTTQATDTNRVKFYINGTQYTDFDTTNWPSQNYDTYVNDDAKHWLGKYTDQSAYYDGYLAEVVVLDGTAANATSFGEFDSSSPNVWKPIDVSGLTFGTNGFYLDFEDSSNLGNDANGGTDLTEVNIVATDQSTDTCTNNFATLNPLTTWMSSDFNLSEGNLKIDIGNNTEGKAALATFGLTTGKWYWEVKYISKTGDTYSQIGITDEIYNDADSGSNKQGYGDYDYSYRGEYSGSGRKVNAGTFSNYGDTWTTGDIIGVALDLDNLAIYFSKNGTFQASGDPTSGASRTNAAFNISAASSTASGYYFPVIAKEDADDPVFEFNFGGTNSASFAISSGNADANGYGNFEYAVPSGYYSICTKNLAEFG